MVMSGATNSEQQQLLHGAGRDEHFYGRKFSWYFHLWTLYLEHLLI
jgi:hypothetical protein